jgi:hypothetical protein
MASLGRATGSAAARAGVKCCASPASSSPPTRLLPESSFMASNNNSANYSKEATFSSDSQDNNHGVRNNPQDDDTAGVNTNEHDDDRIAGMIWQPNQTTTIFRKMENTCPDVMKAYAQCVIEKQNSGALIRDACAVQFQAVMDCFRSVRTSLN